MGDEQVVGGRGRGAGERRRSEDDGNTLRRRRRKGGVACRLTLSSGCTSLQTFGPAPRKKMAAGGGGDKWHSWFISV